MSTEWMARLVVGGLDSTGHARVRNRRGTYDVYRPRYGEGLLLNHRDREVRYFDLADVLQRIQRLDRRPRHAH